MKAGKAHLAGPPAELPPSLAAAVRSGKRSLALAGGLLLGCLVLYVMWPRGTGYGYGYDGVEETEHFVSVTGTQVCCLCTKLLLLWSWLRCCAWTCSSVPNVWVCNWPLIREGMGVAIRGGTSSESLLRVQ